MKPLALFLVLAGAAGASLSPWLALAAAWAALIVLVLAGINAYRDGLEERGDGSETVIGWIEAHRVVRMRRRTP